MLKTSAEMEEGKRKKGTHYGFRNDYMQLGKYEYDSIPMPTPYFSSPVLAVVTKQHCV